MLIQREQLSAEWLASLPLKQRLELIASLDEDEAVDLLIDWRFWARRNQLPPAGDWRVWLFLGGRGAGKTRAGAEWIAQGIREERMRRVALIGATYQETRAVMVEGESGLLAVSHGATFEPSNRRVRWPGGAVATLLSADDPDSIRGYQFDGAWADDVSTGSGGTGDVRATLSKQAVGNTASFLFQDAFSGRAEVGLTGDDNFHFKVSPDGSTWHDAIQLTASSGLATIASATIASADINGGTVDGTAIGASATSTGAFTTLAASGATVLTTFSSNAFKDSKTSANTTVLADTAGRLLVGPTGSFSTALTVAGSTAGFQIAATNGSANLNTVRFTASAGSGGAMSLAHSRAAAIGSFATLAAGDQLGVVNFAGDDGASYNTIGAQIRGVAISGGTISTGIIPGQIVLAAMNAAGTLTDLCRVDNTSGVTAVTQISTPKVSSGAASALDLQTSGGTQFEIAHTASAVNFLQATGSASGAGTATLAAAGTDTNIDVVLTPKGSGAVRLGTVANGSVATALSSVGPTGAHTTVQEWFAVKNASGVVRYIPGF